MGISYAAKVVLANVENLHSKADGIAEPFGEILAAGELTNMIHLVVPIAVSSAGTYELYLVESMDGAEWTDNIDPSTSGDVAVKISDAELIKSVDATYHATNRPEAEFHIPVAMLIRSNYIGFVLLNNSGQTIPATGVDGDSQALTVS